MSAQQKDIERYYLKCFFNTLGEKPKDLIERESPDFTLTVGEARIGLEVTEYHSGTMHGSKYSFRQLEESWKELQAQLRDNTWQDKTLEQMHGHLEFREKKLPPRREYRSFIRELMELSRWMAGEELEEVKPDAEYPLLNNYLRQFTLKNVGCHISWDWNHSASFIGSSEAQLIKIVRPKALKSAEYHMVDYDKLWLLIVCGPRLSQTLPILDQTLQSFAELDRILSSSEFSKAFVFQYMTDVIYEWPGWQQIGKDQLYPTIF